MKWTQGGAVWLHIPTLVPRAWGLPAPCCHRAGAQRGLLHQHGGTAPFLPPPLLPQHPRVTLFPATQQVWAWQCCWGLWGGRQAGTRTRALAWGEKLEVKCLKVRSLFSINLLYLILSTNSNLIASGLKPLQ